MSKKLDFPQNFLWGSATSAYQVEGGIENADWSKFKSAGKACDHYNKFKEDFDIAADKLNQNAHRLSVKWSRVEPEKNNFNQEAIDHYREVLGYLKEKDMKTMVTLHHFTNPVWLAESGGWELDEAPFYFARLSKRVVRELNPLVDFWCTINEPTLYANLSYRTGEWPPQKESNISFLKVLKNQIQAHKQTFEEIHEIDKEAKVGIVKNNQYYTPFSNSLLDQLTVGVNSYLRNNLFLDLIRNKLDFIGLNYYFHNRIQFPYKLKNKNEVTSDLGWEVYPEGIYYALKNLKKYELPIYITENGLADKEDELRKQFIKKHLYWVHKAISEGVDIRGYFHWSLLDNFEWAEGFEPRFGLVEVDYENQERVIRDSAEYYADVADSNSLHIPGNWSN
ncbi:MAG: glycoside hydrolase family 1 protein [Candidatus Magasanikbacteria bacterium]